MPIQDVPVEDSVRKLSEIGWTTREIASKLRISQSTVVRTQQKINTGPHPIIRPDTDSDSASPRRWRLRRPQGWVQLHPGTLLVVAMMLLAAVALTVLWVRVLKPAPVPAQLPQVIVCVRYSPDGTITGLTAGGGCPPGWKSLVLIAGTPAS